MTRARSGNAEMGEDEEVAVAVGDPGHLMRPEPEVADAARGSIGGRAGRSRWRRGIGSGGPGHGSHASDVGRQHRRREGWPLPRFYDNPRQMRYSRPEIGETGDGPDGRSRGVPRHRREGQPGRLEPVTCAGPCSRSGRSLAALEQGLGVELVRRTTRWSNRTEGRTGLLSACQAGLHGDPGGRAGDRQQPDRAVGPADDRCPALFAPSCRARHLRLRWSASPEIEVELRGLRTARRTSWRRALDLAVRIRDMPDSDLKARRLGSLRIVVFGAPAYFSPSTAVPGIPMISAGISVPRTTDSATPARALPHRRP